jgi:hypothetical protein
MEIEEAEMKAQWSESSWMARKIFATGFAGVLLGTAITAPVSAARATAPVNASSGALAAGKAPEEVSAAEERPIDRAQVENLQRWVSAGHADWCKDARVVAAEELWRLAADFSGDGFELSAMPVGTNDQGRMTFEWAPPDGRAVYRVSVARFEWLLPIAGERNAMVWVPNRVEMLVHKSF